MQAHSDKVKVDKAQINNDKSIIIKKNKVVDQVNQIAKIRTDYLKNINEIPEIMNDLHDDPQLRYVELNMINALFDKSLDYPLELSHGGNREKREITIDKDMCLNRYSDIINDKLDLVNEIGEIIDSYMADAYNIVDGINKSHNNDSLYDILAEDLKKCKDTILKIINSSNICAKQDTKKTDADNATVCDKKDTNNDKADTTNNNNDKTDTKVKDKRDTKKKNAKKKDSKPDTKVKDAKKKDSKPDTKVKDKPDTKVKDKPDTKAKDKPDTKVKDKPDTKVKDKPDTKVKDKQDIESSASKNEPQKTLSNGKPAKIFDSIKEILKYFTCGKFMNEKFNIKGSIKDGITLQSLKKNKERF